VFQAGAALVFTPFGGFGDELCLTIMLEFRVKAFTITGRRSSGVGYLRSFLGGRIYCSGGVRGVKPSTFF
jgi:hypothetical protein